MASAQPFPPPWEFVTSNGIIELVADHSELKPWADIRKLQLNNVRHHLQFFTGNGQSHHVAKCVVRQKLQWMQRRNCKEYVPVLGGSEYFYVNIVGPRHGLDMPFSLKKLNEHLSHARRYGPALKGFLSDFNWQVVSAPSPSDMSFWLSRAVQSKTAAETPSESQPAREPAIPDFAPMPTPAMHNFRSAHAQEVSLGAIPAFSARRTRWDTLPHPLCMSWWRAR